jgi:predicted dehydrogenase
MLRIGIIGLGYWGPNLLRNFDGLADAKVTAYCDINEKRLDHIRSRYPGPFTTNQPEDILDPRFVDAVVIATPTKTHYSLAKIALERGLHTFVEKPLATSSVECLDLINSANKKSLVLLVGHVLLYNAAVIKLKELVQSGYLGNICYISSSRLNLGPIRQDVNALWDLTPHDISVILHLIDDSPISVNCQGLAYLTKSVHDVCTLTLQFKNGCMALIHASWLDPNKVRRMTVVGDKKMAVFDDIETLEKIKVYDKGVDKPGYSDTFGEFHFSYRYGDMFSPWIKESEPLKTECQHFLECIKQGKKPKTDGENGLKVVRILEAATASLNNGGGRVELFFSD